MTKPPHHATKAWLWPPALPVLLVSLAIACATPIHPPQTFLHSSDDSWNRWLDTVVDVDVAEVRIIHLPLTDAFAGASLVIARADAPVESLKVALHANRVTRRQALWLIAEKYRLSMTLEHIPGQAPYISIAKE